MGLEDWGSLVLRIALGAIFLHGAWFSGHDAVARAHLDAAAATVFPWNTALFARAGTAIAFIAGVSVLFGIFPRVGALLMALFLVPAALIHLGLKRHVVALKDKIAAALGPKAKPALRKDLEELGDCAALGHMTSALKNLALIGPALYLMLAGAREPLLIDLGPGGHWQGLLTRF
jgi:uncharacterized membrane protein YphA (DoxX/SURF4 family)